MFTKYMVKGGSGRTSLSTIIRPLQLNAVLDIQVECPDSDGGQPFKILLKYASLLATRAGAVASFVEIMTAP